MAAEQEQPNESYVDRTYEEAHYEDEGGEYAVGQEASQTVQTQKKPNQESVTSRRSGSGFVHGLSVGLGIGCIAAFVMTWLSVFFTPQLPPAITYEALLSIFVFPLVYLLAVGLVALTAGIVREYYSIRNN